MFKLNTYRIETAARARGDSPRDLFNKNLISADTLHVMENGTGTAETYDFKELCTLGEYLGIAPLALIQNNYL